MVNNELLYFTNEFNFNELAGRNYKPIDREGFPLLWIKDNRIILPKPKISSMKESKKFEEKSFLPDSLNSLGISKQRRFLVNHFMPITEREDVYFDFIGFMGLELKRDFFKTYEWYINSSQIESIISPDFGVKYTLNPKKEIITFQTDEIPNVPEVDVKLEFFWKYTKDLQNFFEKDLRKRSLNGMCISRYHGKEQQRKFMDFYKNLEIVSAKDMLEKIGGEFFSHYVKY